MESYELFITKNTEIFKDKVIILYTYLLRFYRIPVHFINIFANLCILRIFVTEQKT